MRGYYSLSFYIFKPRYFADQLVPYLPSHIDCASQEPLNKSNFSAQYKCLSDGTISVDGSSYGRAEVERWESFATD